MLIFSALLGKLGVWSALDSNLNSAGSDFENKVWKEPRIAEFTFIASHGLPHPDPHCTPSV